MNLLPILLVALIVLGGCKNVGVVYSEYQQFSLASVRVTPENTAPLDVTIGWDQGSMAIVSRRNSGDQEEAVSVIAKTELGGDPGGDLLSADSFFISGIAAVVASVGDGKTVKIEAPKASGGMVEVKTEGSPGDRIRAAFGIRSKELEQTRLTAKSLQVEIDAVLFNLQAGQLDLAIKALQETGLSTAPPDPALTTEDEKRKYLKKLSRLDDDSVESGKNFRDELRKISEGSS